MKLPIALMIIALAIGSDAFAQSAPSRHGSSSDGSAQPGNFGTFSTGAPSAATPNENNTDESDDTLYRGKTSDSENPMLRDEGALHFKTRPKEKVQEVDSLKNLHSSGSSDPKFQSNLLSSGVSSIEDLGAKANQTRDAEDESDPRFKTKRLVFTPEKNDQSKQAQSDSTPSPTPSPTASPAAKDSSKQ